MNLFKHKNQFNDFDLGMIYFNGLGVEKDYKKAAQYFAKAARKGHAQAQLNLALMY